MARSTTPRAPRSGDDAVRSGAVTSTPSFALRLVATGAGALVLFWLVLAVTLDVAGTNIGPEFALRLWPAGSGPKVALALQQLQTGDRLAASQARQLASAALLREPVSAAAARTLGLAQAASGNRAAADRSIAVAEGLSRRDLPTEYYLIQQRVERGDVAGALRHYDVALRTARESYDTLLPTLARSSAESAIRQGLLPLLAARPVWWPAYLTRLITADPAPGVLADQVRALRLSPNDPVELALLQQVLGKLTSAGAFDEAATLVPASARQGGLRDGGFEHASLYPPFDWWLSEDAHLSAVREPAPAGRTGFVLRLNADQERGGEVAHQLLALSPGAHRITGVVGDSAAAAVAAPRLEVSCARTRAQLTTLPLITQSRSANRVVGQFDVPAGCTFQWLSVVTPSAGNTSAWIGQLAID